MITDKNFQLTFSGNNVAINRYELQSRTFM